MIFVLKDFRSRTIITISNKTFNIVREIELLINATNNLVLFRYFKMSYIKKIINKSEYVKTQIIIFENKKSISLKINASVFFFQFDKKNVL